MAESAYSLSRSTLRVSDVTRYVRALVEGDAVLSALSVRGEISELTRSANGHLYFSLKDNASQMACVMFRGEAARQVEEVRELRRGVSVVAHGFLTVYEPRGAYQMYVERVLPLGEGALFQKMERLKAQLEQEGLFAQDRKRPLPAFPRSIALVTSPDSQAYHDVLHRLRSQYPFVSVIVAGASVQGEGAADEMAMAIDIVNRLTDAEIILLVRGGGSPEELSAFNDERLARTIYASRVPVVTGVGHEMDYTVVDFVADVRAATPSLAAAAAVPDIAMLVQQSTQLHSEIGHAVRRRLHAERRQWLDLNAQLLRSSPQHRLRANRQRVDERTRDLQHGVHTHVRVKRAKLQALRSQLQALDPLAILDRGYALLTDPETGRVVSRAQQAVPGKRLEARVSDGRFSVRVEKS